ncbi:MAG: hypothetical protein KZQ66_15875 [Candidatus Thiodiazotropha sp. (ex Lucinoma aequizonata)]|nr:hypothetical protein [Candidatus Thiodiazotropha sp. (ex Lucinoma aequizonata)]MCU7889244.1 hypothetical protein [Candidatus Thiodiazotropha sp. (ex Lucinoma aequizonata)]MCU7895822.1 hypothetical protein [Candidatus Thiodiazotropha sp. (ex Lucinoma aequizonata)]MCU7899074.1 hypothetical protein [Candidatus Thiodiazotropha sp. (ex Lucinoma aequizonata)]MCU7903287.1 hypothetical protein [Candidatus Thiodiazotropha sp. (ex Lucinoma aequizonata)]
MKDFGTSQSTKIFHKIEDTLAFGRHSGHTTAPTLTAFAPLSMTVSGR